MSSVSCSQVTGLNVLKLHNGAKHFLYFENGSHFKKKSLLVKLGDVWLSIFLPFTDGHCVFLSTACKTRNFCPNPNWVDCAYEYLQ